MPEAVPSSEPPASWARDADTAHDVTLEENWLFRLRKERFRSRLSGVAHDYYVLHLADAVNVIALTPDRRLVLVRQFRAGSARDSLETPGGLLDAGEDPLVAAARELAEETGYVGDPPRLLGTVWSVPSIMTSRMSFVLIENVHQAAETKFDHAEEVTVELVSERSVPRLIREGGIDHALVVCGLLWWFESRFPGRLALPAPRKRLHIGTIMLATAAIATGLGIGLGGSSFIGAFATVVLIVAIVTGVVVSAWPRNAGAV